MAKGDYPSGALVEVLREYKDSGGSDEVYQKAKAEFKHLMLSAIKSDDVDALRSLLSDALKALEPMAKAGNNIHPDFNSDTAYFELPVLGVQLRTTAELHARIKEVVNSQ